MIIVSGCLAGLRCKYNGEDSSDARVVELVKHWKIGWLQRRVWMSVKIF